MKKTCLAFSIALALAGLAVACTKSSPTRPTDASASDQVSTIQDAKTGVTLTTPQLVTPTSGQRFKFADQPLTLAVRNGVSTGSSPLTYSFQVASDAGFASVVYSKDGVAEGSGQTTLKIDKLAGNKDYFWRARVSTGSATGLFSPGRAFNVGPEVVIQAPTLLSPAQNGTLNGVGSLVAQNAAKSGPAGQIFYRFEVSDTQAFGNLKFVSTTAEQAGQTSVQMTAALVTNAIYYWRVQASDPSNGISGPYSSVFSFEVRAVRHVAGDHRGLAERPRFLAGNLEGDAGRLAAGRHRAGFRPSRRSESVAGRAVRVRINRVHARDVSVHQLAVALFSGGAVLVRSRIDGRRASQSSVVQLVLRSGAMGSDDGLSAVTW